MMAQDLTRSDMRAVLIHDIGGLSRDSAEFRRTSEIKHGCCTKLNPGAEESRKYRVVTSLDSDRGRPHPCTTKSWQQRFSGNWARRSQRRCNSTSCRLL